MAQFDWSKFTLKIFIHKDMATVYEMFSTQRKFEDWFLRKAEFTSADGVIKGANELIATGDTYSWMWHGHPDETNERGVITELNGIDRFRFVFGAAGFVTFQLKAHEADTEFIMMYVPVKQEG